MARHSKTQTFSTGTSHCSSFLFSSIYLVITSWYCLNGFTSRRHPCLLLPKEMFARCFSILLIEFFTLLFSPVLWIHNFFSDWYWTKAENDISPEDEDEDEEFRRECAAIWNGFKSFFLELWALYCSICVALCSIICYLIKHISILFSKCCETYSACKASIAEVFDCDHDFEFLDELDVDRDELEAFDALGNQTELSNDLFQWSKRIVF